MVDLQIQVHDKGNNSELIDFKGKVKWVTVVDPNKFGKWSLQMYPDTESLERIRELQAQGIKNVMKKDEEGYFMQISRPLSVEFSKGVATPLTPPKVRDKDKKPIDGRSVGDGSDCTVTCEKYGYTVPQSKQRGIAIRLYGLTVLDLVPKDVPEPTPDVVEAGWE